MTDKEYEERMEETVINAYAYNKIGTKYKEIFESRKDRAVFRMKSILQNVDGRIVVELWDWIDELEEINQIKGKIEGKAKSRADTLAEVEKVIRKSQDTYKKTPCVNNALTSGFIEYLLSELSKLVK